MTFGKCPFCGRELVVKREGLGYYRCPECKYECRPAEFVKLWDDYNKAVLVLTEKLLTDLQGLNTNKRRKKT